MASSVMAFQRALGAAIDAANPLSGWLEGLAQRFRAGERPTLAEGPFGVHGVRYGTEDGEPFAVVGFCLPDDTYVEMNGGRHSYAEVGGFRLFFGAEKMKAK